MVVEVPGGPCGECRATVSHNQWWTGKHAHHGKPCCHRSKCKRTLHVLPNKECEECCKAQEEKRSQQRTKEAAATLGGIAEAASPCRAAAVSPRRHAHAVPIQQQCPPVQPAARPPLHSVFQVVGQCMFNPANITSISPIGAPWKLGTDFDKQLKKEALDPHYLVRGSFVADDELENEEDERHHGVHWVPEDELLLAFECQHDAMSHPALLAEMLGFSWGMQESARVARSDARRRAHPTAATPATTTAMMLDSENATQHTHTHTLVR